MSRNSVSSAPVGSAADSTAREVNSLQSCTVCLNDKARGAVACPAAAMATHRPYPRNLRPNALATALLVSLTVSRNRAYSRRSNAITRSPAL